MAAQSPKELQPGEHVSWNFGTGQVHGQVVEKLTHDKKLGARVFKASPDDPKYLVKSDTSGKEAIKKPDTLHKTDGDDAEGDDEVHLAKEESNRNAIDAQKGENGAKEKRDDLMQRSTEEEQKEAQEVETEQKVQKTGKGSAREIARKKKKKIAAKNRDTEVDDEFLEEDEEEEEEEDDAEEDDDYKPREEDLKAVEDEEVVILEQEKGDMETKEAKNELTELREATVEHSGKGAGGEEKKLPLKDFIVEDGGEEDDTDKQYEPSAQEVKAQDGTEAAPSRVDLDMAEEARDKGK